jgi:hypothetical protein
MGTYSVQNHFYHLHIITYALIARAGTSTLSTLMWPCQQRWSSICSFTHDEDEDDLKSLQNDWSECIRMNALNIY